MLSKLTLSKFLHGRKNSTQGLFDEDGFDESVFDKTLSMKACFDDGRFQRTTSFDEGSFDEIVFDEMPVLTKYFLTKCQFPRFTFDEMPVSTIHFRRNIDQFFYF